MFHMHSIVPPVRGPRRRLFYLRCTLGGACPYGQAVLGSQAMRRRPTSSEIVLALLCLMYLITYVDRVNIATAANEIKHELELSNTQLAFILSAFGYPYAVFQIFGGWVGDRVGARRTMF